MDTSTHAWTLFPLQPMQMFVEELKKLIKDSSQSSASAKLRVAWKNRIPFVINYKAQTQGLQQWKCL